MNTFYIPNNLKVIRRAAFFRQQDLAEKLGIPSFDRISKWEMGLCYPSLDNFAKLLNIFKVKPEDIYPELFGNLNDKPL